MATAQRDYYEVLGVPRDADPRAIKDAFRQLALRYHPDRNKEPEAEARFKEIAEAYAVLSDPTRRANYDAGGLAGVAGLSPEDLWRGIDFGDLLGGLGFDWRGEGLFDRLFRRRPAGPARGANLEVEVVVPLERVRHGGEERVRVGRPQPCGACHGVGAKPGTAPRACGTCTGSGEQVKTERRGDVAVRQITTCPACHGQGRLIDEPCSECRGGGQVTHEEALTVKIPLGVEDGMVLRVPGKGLPSREPGGAPGDLFVVVRSAPDPRFERDGADLWRVERIAVPDAVLGTTLDVPTLDGAATLTVPAGTQPGTVLRLRGQGLPEFGGGRRGDLHVRLEVEVPQRLSTDERQLYERLRHGSAPHHRRGRSRGSADAGANGSRTV
jgi:molecular chaperone DnaJ